MCKLFRPFTNNWTHPRVWWWFLGSGFIIAATWSHLDSWGGFTHQLRLVVFCFHTLHKDALNAVISKTCLLLMAENRLNQLIGVFLPYYFQPGLLHLGWWMISAISISWVWLKIRELETEMVDFNWNSMVFFLLRSSPLKFWDMPTWLFFLKGKNCTFDEGALR